MSVERAELGRPRATARAVCAGVPAATRGPRESGGPGWSLRPVAERPRQGEQRVRAARLHAGADARILAAAERLATDDGTRDRAIHVEIAGVRPLEKEPLLARVEALEARR